MNFFPAREKNGLNQYVIDQIFEKKRSSDFKFVLTLVYLNCYSRMLENISLNKV